MVKQFAKSAANAWRGIAFVWRGERNFRIQGTITVVLIITAIVLRFSIGELIAILTMCAAVLAAEMVNTIVEEMLDVIEPHYSTHVGKLKDVTAGVVFLLSAFAAVIGILTFLHHFLPSMQLNSIW